MEILSIDRWSVEKLGSFLGELVFKSLFFSMLLDEFMFDEAIDSDC